MCDYSLTNVKSRPASVGDKLTTRNFGTGTRGFSAAEDCEMAVCVLPGTELAFIDDIERFDFYKGTNIKAPHNTAIFRQIHREVQQTHHDALELPDGTVMLLTSLQEGQKATVLQLPAMPKTKEEEAEQKRVAFAG